MFKRLMAVTVACTLMLGCSTSEDGDDDNGNKAGTYTIEKSDTLIVAENVTVVTTEDGVKVDFGCLLESGEKVTVEKVSISSTDPDVEIYAYNFELSTGEIDGAVVLTIPYDETGIEAGAEQSSICGRYYNDRERLDGCSLYCRYSDKRISDYNPPLFYLRCFQDNGQESVVSSYLGATGTSEYFA